MVLTLFSFIATTTAQKSDQQGVSIALEMKPILKLNMDSPDQINFIFDKSCLPKTEEMLENGIHKVGYLLKNMHTNYVSFSDDDEFINLNDKEEYFKQLMKLKHEAKHAIHSDNSALDKLVRKNLITTDMTSSLVNDHVNVNDLIKRLIQVAELLYVEKDMIIENGH